jgi:transposase
MLALSPSQRILLAVQPVDFRKGIDGLIGLCRQRLNENPDPETVLAGASALVARWT